MVKGLNRVRRNLQQGRRLGRKAFKHGSGTTPREAAEIMNHKAEAGEKGLLNRSNANVHGDRVDPEDEEQMELLRSRKKNLILRRATVGKNSALRFGVEISKKKQKVLLKAAKRVRKS